MSHAASHPMIHDFMGSWQQLPEVAAALAAAWRGRRARRAIRRDYRALLRRKSFLLDDIGVTPTDVRALLKACH